MAVVISLAGVGKTIQVLFGLAYKLAWLFLAYLFVTSTTNFYGFAAQAVKAFYALSMQHTGIPT